MARNYKKEAEWAKEKYERIECKIDKKVGQTLKRILKENKTPLAFWLTVSALVYINVKEQQAELENSIATQVVIDKIKELKKKNNKG